MEIKKPTYPMHQGWVLAEQKRSILSLFLVIIALPIIILLMNHQTNERTHAASSFSGAIGFASYSGDTFSSLNSLLWPNGGHQVQSLNGYNQGNGEPNGISWSSAVSSWNALHTEGVMPMASWGTDAISNCNSCIASGQYDAQLITWANNLKSLGYPIVLRLDWEMNGWWYGWATGGTSSNTPASFVAMWQHIHTVFSQQGVTNVLWFWCPNTQMATGDIQANYPGNNYVDFVGVDIYNWGSAHTGNTWKTFTQLMTNSANDIRAVTTTKPWILGEVGCCPTSTNNSGNGQTQGSWITSAFLTEIPQNFPEIQAFMWFNENKSGECNFRFQDDPNTLASMQQVAASRLWQGRFPL